MAGFDGRENFGWRTCVDLDFAVRIDRLEVVVLRLDGGARNRPAALAVGAGGQQLEELFEALHRQRRFLADLHVRQVVIPDILRAASLGEEKQVGLHTGARIHKRARRQRNNRP